MIFAQNYDEWRNAEPQRTGALDHCNLFSISRLPHFYPRTPLRRCDDYSAINNAHHKPGLVEVVDVRILDAVLRDSVAHKAELRVYRV